ncbi:MAG TPA: trypsin-like peptidase domain-containing protein [Anaerovoracaceae bacterium]|nr:trypsin-like peptidase domain-containing protein [Anaerovoracaceae bacterium]
MDNINHDEYSEISESSPYVRKKHFIILLILFLFFGMGLGYLIRDSITDGNNNLNSINSSNSSLNVSTDSNLSIQQIVAKNVNSVVEIKTEKVATASWLGSFVTEGAGSGVIIAEDGYIATNNHVVEKSSKITVTTYDGNQYTATLVGADEQNDLAVIKISASSLDPVNYGDNSVSAVGDLAVAIGNPLGELGGTATTGIISSLDREIQLDNLTLNLLQTDAAINPGNSGGGLFNGNGNLIGIVVAKSGGEDVEGLAFAIPVNIAKPILQDIMDNGVIDNKPVAGITIVDVDDKDKKGVYIYEVTGTNAMEAGLKSGDKVLSLNNVKIVSSSQLVNEIQKNSIDDTVTFIILRDDEELNISFKLQASSMYS